MDSHLRGKDKDLRLSFPRRRECKLPFFRFPPAWERQLNFKIQETK